MKAADIKDAEIYELVEREAAERGLKWGSSFYIHDALGERFPYNVIRAKLYQMVNKGRLNGCSCGCRGDFTVPYEFKDWRLK
jgi:hypothetical protein